MAEFIEVSTHTVTQQYIEWRNIMGADLEHSDRVSEPLQWSVYTTYVPSAVFSATNIATDDTHAHIHTNMCTSALLTSS